MASESYRRMLYLLLPTPEAKRARGKRVRIYEVEDGHVSIRHELPARVFAKDRVMRWCAICAIALFACAPASPRASRAKKTEVTPSGAASVPATAEREPSAEELVEGVLPNIELPASGGQRPCTIPECEKVAERSHLPMHCPSHAFISAITIQNLVRRLPTLPKGSAEQAATILSIGRAYDYLAWRLRFDGDIARARRALAHAIRWYDALLEKGMTQPCGPEGWKERCDDHVRLSRAVDLRLLGATEACDAHREILARWPDTRYAPHICASVDELNASEPASDGP